MDDIKQKERDLILEVEKKLPRFAESCKNMEAQITVFHQDAYAADYQNEEYTLLGMAIKYAGLFGKEISIFGKNRETLMPLSKK